MKVYVGTYAKYNSGNLFGEWLDVADYSSKDEFLEACAELHKDESDAEFMFQDYENIPESLISESSIDEIVFELANEDEETLENYGAFVSAFGESDFSKFQDAFCGRYKSEVDYAESYIDDTGSLESLPENLRYYFDYEKFARDLFIDDMYFDDETGCVFSRNY